MIVDLVILAALGYAAYNGTRRGAALIGFELLSFFMATLVALAVYHSVGALLKFVAGVTLALANIGAFLIIWMLVEVICALLVRRFVLPRLQSQTQLSRLNQAGGGALNVGKALVLIMVGLVLFSGLPLSAGVKRPVTSSFVASKILASSGVLQQWIGSGLGSDLSQSMNFFTVPSDPESKMHVDLGFTTTNIQDYPEGEAQMLELTNRERTSRGLPALTLHIQAREVARAYSARMLAQGYFSHLDPDGHNPFDRMKAAGIKFNAAGENLALAPTIQLAEQGLMNSPGHKANILSPAYHQVGIGVIDAGPYGLMITEDFTD